MSRYIVHKPPQENFNKECDFSYYILSGRGYFLINEEREECAEGVQR